MEKFRRWIGKRVIVHGCPTAWIGTLTDVYRIEGTDQMACSLADAGLWTNGELSDISCEMTPEQLHGAAPHEVEIAMVSAMWLLPEHPAKPAKGKR